MKPTLKPGLKHFVLLQSAGEQDGALHLSRIADIIAQMPKVFATGFMIVLMEWTCTQLMAPHLDDGEGSLGTHVDVSHLAATPSVYRQGRCGVVDGRWPQADVQGKPRMMART